MFAKDSELRRMLREALRAAPDLSRALARLSVGRGGPRDLGNIRDAIKAARALRDWLGENCSGGRSGGRVGRDQPGAGRQFRAWPTGWSNCWWKSRLILRAMAALSAPGCMRRWMRCGRCAMNPRRVIASLESRYRAESGVAALKIKHNGVLGYFIEVTQQHADKLMAMREICSAIARPWRARCAFPPTNWRAWPAASPKRANSLWRWKNPV